METKIIEIAQRIKGLRTMLEITPQEMAEITGVTLEQYEEMENGRADFSFTFLYRCASHFGVDLMEIVTGEMPKLSFYTVVRAGKGIPIKRREGFEYQHIAPFLKNKQAEPFLVTAPYSEQEQNQPIHLSYHPGQEMDYILRGSLKVAMEDHVEVLHEGDCIFYDSGHGHGMIATGGEECRFLAIVMRPDKEEE